MFPVRVRIAFELRFSTRVAAFQLMLLQLEQVSVGVPDPALALVMRALSLVVFAPDMSTGWNGNGCVAGLVLNPEHCVKLLPGVKVLPGPGVTFPQTSPLFLIEIVPFEPMPPPVIVRLFLKSSESR